MRVLLPNHRPIPVSLNTFHAPRPSRRLIQLLGGVNDAIVLPHVARIRKIHLPEADAARLHIALKNPTVICPNHPEFFTDWMLDKWLGSRFDPLTASWADPEVVNGMGAAMRRFWLSNNLVAAVRGEGLEAALDYSAANLARGHAVLIHPEGEVNWDNEALGALKGGCIQIALRGAAQAGRTAHVVPLVWFIRFCEDATPGLQEELDYVQTRLGFRSSRVQGPAERMVELYQALLEREASRYQLDTGRPGQSFLERFDIALSDALKRLADHWPGKLSVESGATPWQLARNWIRAARRQKAEIPAELRHQVQTLERMLRLLPARGDKSHLTQEQVAERVKRLRSDWLQNTLRDQVARFFPRAAAPREVFMTVGDPVAVAATDDSSAQIDIHLQSLGERMRSGIESARQAAWNRTGAPVRYLNPFLHPAG
jgi:hypothetical protein